MVINPFRQPFERFSCTRDGCCGPLTALRSLPGRLPRRSLCRRGRQVGDRARVGFLVLFFAEDRRAFAYRFGGEYGFEAAAYSGFVKPFAQHVGQRAVVGAGDVLDFEPRGVGFGSGAIELTRECRVSAPPGSAPAWARGCRSHRPRSRTVPSRATGRFLRP